MIQIPQEKKTTSVIRKVCVPVLLFISIMGTLFSMLQIPFLPPIVLTQPIESFRILVNLLFTISEGQQAYQYQHFAVSVSPENYVFYSFIALAIISVLVSACAILATKYKFLVLVIFAILTGLQIYFGVFAAPVWNILLYASLAAAILQKANLQIFFGVSIPVTLIALLFFPGANPFLAELSEAIRDQFGPQQERQTITTQTPQETAANYEAIQHLYEQTANPTQNGGRELAIDQYERFAGSQIGTAFGQRLWVLWLIGLAFAVGFLLWQLNKIIAAYKRRAIFNSPDANLAIDHMFKHLILWFATFGIEQKNTPYAKYEIADLLHDNVGYLEIVNLWQKTVFSNHQMTEDDRKHMYLFLTGTQAQLLKNKNPLTKMRIRIKLFMAEVPSEES